MILWHVYPWISTSSTPVAGTDSVDSLSHHPSFLIFTLDMSSKQHPISMQSWSMQVFVSVSMFMSLPENVAYHFCFPILSHSSYLDGLWDTRHLNVQLLFCGMLLPGFVQNNMQYSCVVPIMCFSIFLIKILVVHPYNCNHLASAWKNSSIFRELSFPHIQYHLNGSSCLFCVYVDIDVNRWDTATKLCELVN